MQLLRLKWMLPLRYSRKFCTSAHHYSSVTKFQPVVGLEVHMQIDSKSKLFSSAPTTIGGPINGQVATFDAAIPGTLPVVNRRCVEAAIQTALALDCAQINNVSRFDRKHYFYSDMPAGFQITQQFHPIAREGRLRYYPMTSSGTSFIEKSCRILQVQLEQDSGKSIHDADNMLSLIDLNRAGIGLLEIVFAPDLSSGIEALNLVKELIAVVRSIGVCSGRMEEGAVRVDANVSVHEPGTPLGVRTEVKNLNSLRSVSRAIDYEINRQMSCLEKGMKVDNVTLTFDCETMSTVTMRDKEAVQDYRFFPEPNIPLLNLEHAGICVESLRSSLPPLPQVKRKRLMDAYGLEFWQAAVIVREAGFFELFTEAMNCLPIESSKLASHILVTDVLGCINEMSIDSQCDLSPKYFAELVDAVQLKRVSKIKYKEVLRLVIQTKLSPEQVIKDNNWSLITDKELLKAFCDEAIQLFPKEARKARMGKERAFNPLLKHVRLATQNRADMKQVSQIMREKLQQPEVGSREEVHISR
ncbi:glutamyl-tRNA(Gln) amidotransferase subunit B [Tropilaelaps mercedesae]|uniref:Glutamyl-tRNA(Gln) amidotransferase subunit B, mitochondrial n=1 Tax=Tropilaelaps mercedesae TaxID=418985 RepID=A0A1V9XGS8_9ACAR|nr:glutamyl-tRNA(Gln) amidotransferase subunit B [Tropilaelaps mercedesae]